MALPELPAEARRLLVWLTFWVILPSAPFMILWFVGGPPRSLEIIGFGIIGLCLRRAPRLLQLAAWFAAFGYMCLSFVSAMFNLGIWSMAHSLRFAADLRLGESPHYLVMAAALLVTFLAAFLLSARDQEFRDWRLIPVAAIAVLGFQMLDYRMTHASQGSYNRSAPGDTPWQAGIEHLDLAGAIAARRNVIVIVVESLGVPRDARVRGMLTAPFDNPAIRARYNVSTGTTPYFGSTTAGEIRELCGRWGEYHGLENRRDDGCLPARLRAAGYDTTAVHSFTGSFFNRAAWYPNIGFDRMIFGQELIERGARTCPGVFPGACDRDVAAMLLDQLRGKDDPQFLYFLTVNTHLPVLVDPNMGTEDCANFDPTLARDFAMICRLMQGYRQIASELVTSFTDPDLPPSDILIVGDHMPPFYDRAHRDQFSGSHVPWILLEHRAQGG
ncbi:MAG: sulfatase-like hydrolase/transferase [Sphingomonadales bacterium]|nr:sulfatase-like hydrolase/transferase [Sphingomonadales bacterium]